MVDTIIAVLSLVVGILGLYFTIRNRSAPTRANTVLPTTRPVPSRESAPSNESPRSVAKDKSERSTEGLDFVDILSILGGGMFFAGFSVGVFNIAKHLVGSWRNEFDILLDFGTFHLFFANSLYSVPLRAWFLFLGGLGLTYIGIWRDDHSH